MRRPFDSPAARVVIKHQDVWSIINEAAAASSVQPLTNMGQGFFGYNPPQFILDAAKDSIERIDCNQYAPTKGRPRLKLAIAKMYSAQLGRDIDADTEVTITTGANEGMLSAFMAFVEPGDEVIVFEPFFDQYIHNIEYTGGRVVYVPLIPPQHEARRSASAGQWTFDISRLQAAVTKKTRMLVLNNPQNPTGKVFSIDELNQIGKVCEDADIIILSDEVYDSLTYVEFTRFASLSESIARRTLTVGSAGKSFYCTGWRVGWLVGPSSLIRHVSTAHTRICFSSVSPLQEAIAIGLEVANDLGFWSDSKVLLKQKIDRFCQVWIDLNLPVRHLCCLLVPTNSAVQFSTPQGGYFLLVNFAKVRLPEAYKFPEHIAQRPRDFKLAWFLIQELGVAAIPSSEFFTDNTAAHVGDWLRFAVCKDDSVLDEAASRLQSLRPYIENDCA